MKSLMIAVLVFAFGCVTGDVTSTSAQFVEGAESAEGIEWPKEDQLDENRPISEPEIAPILVEYGATDGEARQAVDELTGAQQIIFSCFHSYYESSCCVSRVFLPTLYQYCVVAYRSVGGGRYYRFEAGRFRCWRGKDC